VGVGAGTGARGPAGRRADAWMAPRPLRQRLGARNAVWEGRRSTGGSGLRVLSPPPFSRQR